MPDIDQKQNFFPDYAFDFDSAENVATMTGWISFAISAYDSSIGYGWDNTTGISFAKRASGDSVQRDFHYYLQDRTFIVDVANGTYSVNVIVGDAAYPHDQIDITVEETTHTVTTASGEFKVVAFSDVEVSDGQLNILFHDAGGNDPNWVVNGITIDSGSVEAHYCSPVAEANSLWWLDKAYGLGIFETPSEGTGYIGGDINGDGVSDVKDLVQELAILMKTNVGHNGTLVQDEQDGIDAFLFKYVIAGELFELTTAKPTLKYIIQEVKVSKDVKLDLGFWHVDEVEHSGSGPNEKWIVTWRRVGGHSVSVAGVDSATDKIAISDPYFDAAEVDPLKGIVRPEPDGHPTHIDDFSIHDDEANSSHDYYDVVPSISPGGMFALYSYNVVYPGLQPDFEENNGLEQTLQITYPDNPEVTPSQTFAEIEAAVSVYPKIIVQAPNGGEVVPSGAIYPISWSSSLPGAVVEVRLSKDNGVHFDTSICETGATYCLWNVPKTIASIPKCRVKVGYLNGDAMVGYDTSDQRFKIAAVDITNPDGGETLKQNAKINISWETYTAASVANTELYYKCGTDKWSDSTKIATINGNPGTYEWTVPNVTEDKCKVRVMLKKKKPRTDPAEYVNVAVDASDGTFKIQP
jgi:hypothetical protein